MTDDGLHEALADLSFEARDMHRALASLREELQAVDCYGQRAGACANPQLRAILLHHMRDEIEHSAMLIEWLRRNDAGFAEELHARLYSDTPVAQIAHQAARGDEEQPGPLSTAEDRVPTIGSLKETRE